MNLFVRILALIATVVISHRHGDPGGGSSSTACDLGPYTSATTLASIQSAINTANDGDVVCLQRGETWNNASGITINASHPNGNRVTVCASTGTSCSSSGAANPKIIVSGSTADIVRVSSGGYTFTGIDLASSAGDNNQKGWNLADSNNVTVLDSVVNGPFHCEWLQGSGTASDNIHLGECGHRIECTGGGPTWAADQGDRHTAFGGCTNCVISNYVHDYPGPSQHPNTSHYWDLAQNGNLSPSTSSHDVTFECGLYVTTTGSSPFSLNKINRGYNLIIRDNECRSSNGSFSNVACFAFADHAAGGTEGITSNPPGTAGGGAQIYRNLFNQVNGIHNGIGADLDIFDNISITTGDNNNRGLYQTHYDEAASDDTQISNVRIFSNTVYSTGSNPNGYGRFVGTNGGSIKAGRTPCSNCQVYNNAIYITENQNALVLNAKNGCSEFGTNGVNIKNNFVYSPNQTPSVLWDTCSADTGNSTTFNTNPSFVSPSTGDFHPSSNASAVCAFGTSGRPTSDYDQAAWTSSEVGAFACPP